MIAKHYTLLHNWLMSSDEKLQPAILPQTEMSAPLIVEEEVSKNLSKLKIKDKPKIIFFGTPEFVVPVLAALDMNFDLVGVVTTPDAKIGRKQILTQTPIAEYGQKLKVPIIKPLQFNNEITEQLQQLTPDLFVVASYGKIIPQSVLDIPKQGSINIHPSKLPLFRGATPIQSQILEGIIDSAISFILLDAKMDHGPLLHQEPFIISPTDTNETLHDEMFRKAAVILPDLINKYLEGKIKVVEQNHEQATFCKPFNRESGYFDLDNPPSVDQLDRMIRAFYPWPTAWTKWKVKSQESRDKDKEMILKFLPDKMVQPEGKKPMKWKEFLNGYKNFPQKDLL